MAAYMLNISYLKSVIAADELMFMQEALLELQSDGGVKQKVKHISLIGALQ